MHTRKQLILSVIAFLFVLAGLNACLSTQEDVFSSVQTPVKNSTIPISSSSLPSSTLNQGMPPTNWTRKAPPPAPSGLPPTWTALPTFSQTQSYLLVMDLYENNPCQLPCWWGIIPGETDWREAWQFLERFATNKYPWDNLLLESKEHPGYMYFQALLDVPQTAEEATYYFSLNHLIFMINMDTFIVDYIDVNTGNVTAYTIPEILTVYGEPTEIYVDFGRSQVPQYSGVSLSLYYPQHGFISTHFTTIDNDEWKKPKIGACFQKVTYLHLWAKDRPLDYIESLTLSSSNLTTSVYNWQSIAEVSDFSVDTFYQTYSDTKRQPCVEFMMKDQ